MKMKKRKSKKMNMKSKETEDEEEGEEDTHYTRNLYVHNVCNVSVGVNFLNRRAKNRRVHIHTHTVS